MSDQPTTTETPEESELVAARAELTTARRAFEDAAAVYASARTRLESAESRADLAAVAFRDSVLAESAGPNVTPAQ
jgi:hypothetical protein